jgi:hypothetical protein
MADANVAALYQKRGVTADVIWRALQRAFLLLQ